MYVRRVIFGVFWEAGPRGEDGASPAPHNTGKIQ